MNPINRNKVSEEQAWDALAVVEHDPQVRAWLLEADAFPSSSRFAGPSLSRRRARVFGIAATVLICVLAGAYWFWAPDRYQTGIGEQRDVTLADGSRMTLNTDTAVAVRYSKGRRYIEMERGEVLFVVKGNSRRPFDVAAGGTLTRALGTEFNVDLRSAKVTVSVLDGAVQVGPISAGAGLNRAVHTVAQGGGEGASVPVSALSKGQALEVRKTDGRMQPRKADLKRIDAWRTRRLEFTDTPLSDAVDEFNRYSTVRVVVGSTDLASVRVSGVFRIGDAEGFLYSLREALKLETHEGPGEVVLMRGGA